MVERIHTLFEIAAIATCVLVIVAFVSAYLNLAHEYEVALLFVVASRSSPHP